MYDDAIASLDEASAYLSVPELGGRYRECAGALAWLPGKTAYDVVRRAPRRGNHAPAQPGLNGLASA